MGHSNRFVAKIIAVLGLLPALWWPVVSGAAEQQQHEERISKPGRYQGYSHALFDGWRRTSQHIVIRDGTRIAIDVFRPTRNNVLHEERLPTIWEHRRYQRAAIDQNGTVHSQLDREDHPMRKLVPYGYVFRDWTAAPRCSAGSTTGSRTSTMAS